MGPDAEWGERIRPFLRHKQAKWRAHIEKALDRTLDELETRFYVGLIAGELVTLVMVAGAARAAGRVGLLGYVFTVPEHRGKGAYTALMAAQMEDCRRAGFTILTLTTARDSTAWRIYQQFGFVADHPETSGRMHWLADANAAARWFATSPVTVWPLVWDDWAALNVTAVRVPAAGEDEELPRSWHLHLPRHGTAEGTFSDVMLDWSAALGRRPRERTTHAVTLRSRTGAVAGWLIAAPDRLTFGESQHVDFYLHPAFVDLALPVLVEALRVIPGPQTAYVTRSDGYRAQALLAAGFHPFATLPAWLQGQDLYAFRIGNSDGNH